MKSIEKPFEYLGEKERQILELCKEIILWGTDPKNAKNWRSLGLKEKATELYDNLSNTDFDNDDKYYKLYEEYDKLKNEYEAMKDEDEDNCAHSEIRGNPKELLEKIKYDFSSGKNISLSKEWETSRENYGDYVDIVINRSEEKIELIITEMHDAFIYEDNLIDEIKHAFENLKLNYKYNEHDHGINVVEYTLKCNTKKFEEFEALLLSIFKIIKKAQRIFNEY